ncbi:uncharacterized protein LOC131935417 [Physella acuta]|uniref:uncharacterized protein LOC131935417 n=1 Tax=Physella acuta TaxID=109671 RepID=UPI0027DC4D73|nr:uncharacterized protein LOC131935417 [Physella acuta]
MDNSLENAKRVGNSLLGNTIAEDKPRVTERIKNFDRITKRNKNFDRNKSSNNELNPSPETSQQDYADVNSAVQQTTDKSLLQTDPNTTQNNSPNLPNTDQSLPPSDHNSPKTSSSKLRRNDLNQISPKLSERNSPNLQNTDQDIPQLDPNISENNSPRLQNTDQTDPNLTENSRNLQNTDQDFQNKTSQLNSAKISPAEVTEMSPNPFESIVYKSEDTTSPKITGSSKPDSSSENTRVSFQSADRRSTIHYTSEASSLPPSHSLKSDLQQEVVTEGSDPSSSNPKVRMPPTARKKQFWYNEIPPSLYQHLPVIPQKYLPGLLYKRRKEILCEELDSEQRQLLKDERVARIYLNPVPVPIQAFKLRSETSPTLLKLKAQERAGPSELEKRVIKTHSIYGATYIRPNERPKTKRTKTEADDCRYLGSLPPYTGPYAYRVKPFEVLKAEVVSDHYQFLQGSNARGRQFSPQAFKKLEAKKTKTTAQAIWRRERFTSPEGCDYKTIKEQIRAAKYQAMAKAVQQAEDGDRVALDNAHLWTDYQEVEPDTTDGTGEVTPRLPSVTRERSRSKSPNKKSRDQYHLEPLIMSTDKLRLELAPSLVHQQKGNFVADPKKNAKCAKQWKKDKELGIKHY